jgi:hypothetical protein
LREIVVFGGGDGSEVPGELLLLLSLSLESSGMKSGHCDGFQSSWLTSQN